MNSLRLFLYHAIFLVRNLYCSDSDDDSNSTPNFVFDQSKSDCTDNESDEHDDNMR